MIFVSSAPQPRRLVTIAWLLVVVLCLQQWIAGTHSVSKHENNTPCEWCGSLDQPSSLEDSHSLQILSRNNFSDTKLLSAGPAYASFIDQRVGAPRSPPVVVD